MTLKLFTFSTKGGKRMNLDHIETFMYVVHLNSIRKAADALFLSQPTVTARIKALEKELDTELFNRHGRRMTLTEKGKAFVPYAEQMIHSYRQGKKQLKGGNNQKEIVIGANIITSQYFIPFALPLWKQAHPHLHFTFISASNDVLIDKLLKKQVDVALIKDVLHNRLQNHEILDNSVRLVVYPGHRFQSHTLLTAQELAEEPMVFFECGAFDWNTVHKIFEVSGVEPRIEFQVNHLEVAKSIILSRSGIGFLPYLCIKKELEQGTLIEIDVSHFMNMKQHVYATYVKHGEEVPLLLADILLSAQAFEK